MTMTTITPATTVAVDAAELKAALAKIKPALTLKSGLEALTCIRVDATSEGVQLTATNLDLWLSTTIPGVVTEPGSLLVPAPILNKLLAAHGKGTVEISGLDAPGSRPKVSCKNASLSFEPVPVDEWPKLVLGSSRPVELNLDVLAELLPAVGPNERPVLCSVSVNDGEYCATDSHRLHIVRTGTDTGDQFLIAGDGVKVMSKYSGAAACSVYKADEHLTVQLDKSTKLVGRLLRYEYPQYRSLIPADQPHRITYTAEMVADLKTLTKLITGSISSPVVFHASEDENITMTITDGTKTATVSTPGNSPLKVAFSPQYLLDLLGGTTSNTLGVTDSLKPGVLREPAPEYGADAERVRLIMPVRV